MNDSKIEDLGCQNSWSQTSSPGKEKYEKVNKCYEEHLKVPHDKSSKKLGNCWWRYTCNTCKICYDVDSSD